MPLSILTYNLLNDASFEERLPRLVAAIAGARADIACLQELPPRPGMADGLAEAAGYPAAASVAFRRPDDGWSEGLAILSRFPVEDVEAIDLRPGVPNCLRATVAGPAGQVDVFCLHLHPRDAELRRREIAIVLAVAAGRRAPLQLLAGDFNAVPGGSTMAVARREFELAEAAALGGPAWSFPTPLRADLAEAPRATLDHVLWRGAAKPLAAGAAGAGSAGWPSDHVGVWVAFEAGGAVVPGA